MNAYAKRTAQWVGVLAVVILMNGCASEPLPRFTLPRYQRAPEKFATLQPAEGRKVYVSPIMVRLDPRNEQLLEPKFSVAAYLTDALEQELQAAGAAPQRATIEIGPALAGAGQAIRERAGGSAGAVFVTGEVSWFGPVDPYNSEFRSSMDSKSQIFVARITLDVKVYSAAGETLFAKRGLCSLVDTSTCGQPSKFRGWMDRPATSETATQMALRQIIADPAFQKALQ